MKWRHAIYLVLAGGLFCAVFFLWPRRDLDRHVLPDGSAITLIELKAGAQHYAPMSSFRQRLAVRLPARWHKLFRLSPPPETSCSYSVTNYLSVWILAEKTNSTAPPQFDLLLGDEDGSFTRDAEHHGQPVSVPLGSGRWLVGLPVAAWPRRAEHISIQVYPHWGEPMFFPVHRDKRLTTFRVKNPARDQRTPAWTGEPWPVTVRDGDMDFTLTSLWLGLGSSQGNPDHKLWVAAEPKDRYTRATFRVTRSGEVLTNWNAHHVRGIRDATGNWSDGNSFYSAIQNGETFNQFGRPPLPAREAWRLTVEFSRLSGFETGELHVVRGVAVPQNGAGGNQVSSFGADKIEVNWEPKSPGSTDPAWFWASLRPLKNDHKLTLVRATDNRGRDVPCKNRGGGQSVTAEALTLAPDATSVDLVFALHAIRVVTFQAKPEFYRP